MSQENKNTQRTTRLISDSLKASNAFKDFATALQNNDYSHTNLSKPKSNEPPMFTIEQVQAANRLLPRLIRTLFFMRMISVNDFDRLFNAWSAANGIGLNEATSNRNNTKRSLQQNEATWNLFEKVLSIMDCQLVDVKIFYKDNNDGSVHEVSLSGSNELILNERKKAAEKNLPKG